MYISNASAVLFSQHLSITLSTLGTFLEPTIWTKKQHGDGDDDDDGGASASTNANATANASDDCAEEGGRGYLFQCPRNRGPQLQEEQ